jgi:glucose-1-phosphate cytidylyltransferase
VVAAERGLGHRSSYLALRVDGDLRMKVVLLCGGLGTRLREETEYKPKPMVDIGGRPLLWHIMKIYAHHGHRHFIICLGYRGEVIKDFFLNYETTVNDFTVRLGQNHDITYHGEHNEQDFRVTLADTGRDTMTGGRVKRVQKYIDADTFMVTYGDGLADVDVPRLVAFHKAHGKMATLTAVRAISRFGIVELADNGRVISFAEKPRTGSWINAGFFVFNRGVFDYLQDDSTVLEHEPLQRIARDGELQAYRHDGFFYAMDTYREHSHLSELWATDQAPWKVWQG